MYYMEKSGENIPANYFCLFKAELISNETYSIDIYRYDLNKPTETIDIFLNYTDLY